MSEKITRISENIRTHDESEYKKGDLSYSRNRTIGSGNENEDEYDAAEIASVYADQLEHAARSIRADLPLF